MQEIPYKIYLNESELPKACTISGRICKTNPRRSEPRHPSANDGGGAGTGVLRRAGAPELDDTTPFIPIPQEIRDFYKMYRPAPLVRAYCLEEKLQTPAKIYYKFEGNNTSGSHKLNSAIAQAYYAKMQGLTGVTTETGAGQWGTALSMACAYLGLDCKVFMVKCSYEQKPFRREVMRTYGASVTPSPSMETAVGRKILAEHPDTTGSLGCAISEAVEAAASHPGYRYVLGSVLNQVMLHQSIIGLETKTAMDQYGIIPDTIIAARGRQQPGRPDRPVHGGEAPGRAGLPDHCRGARLLPQLHPGPVRLRLLRHGHGLPPGQDVHPGQRLHPQRQPRRRPALPRHEPHTEPALPRRAYGGRGRGADQGL